MKTTELADSKELLKDTEKRRYTISEVFASLSFSEFDADDDFHESLTPILQRYSPDSTSSADIICC